MMKWVHFREQKAWRLVTGQQALAIVTPESRNRYADFLRALSIFIGVVGHWLLAAPYIVDGNLIATGNMLESRPWTQWL